MTEVRNPFADPLRFERRVPECAIVIFGATGDLAKRKLLPALYRLAYDRRLPASFAIVGNSRTPMSDDEYRQRMHDAVKQFSEDGAMDEDLWKRFAANLHYVAGDVKDPQLYVALAGQAERDRTGQCPVLSLHAAQLLRGHRRRDRPFASGRGARRRVAPADRRKTLRPRSGKRAGTELAHPRGLSRGRYLPHRSLPGQRNRPEHPGSALRQRNLRAAVEPALRQPRADHGRRIDRRRGTRRATTRKPARCAT